MRLTRFLAATVLPVLFSASLASADVVESFRSGGWSGNAFTDDSGRLSTCVASATYRSGITLYVQVDTTYNWAIGFSEPSWNMKEGADIPLSFRIDRGKWQQGIARATSKTLARMQMPPESYIITRFRRGRTMYVSDGTNNYEFRLTGTSRLLARLAKCVDQNVARYGAAPGMGQVAASNPQGGLGQSEPAQEASAPATETATEQDPQLAIEATQALFNLMGSTGLSGLKLIPDGQRETDLDGLHAVAANDTRTLVAHIFAPGSYESEGELMSVVVGDSQKKCADGSFSSGSRRITQDGKQLYTAFANCETGDYRLSERVAFVPRDAGGIFVYGVADTHVGEGGAAPVSPPELKDADFFAAAVGAAQ